MSNPTNLRIRGGKSGSSLTAHTLRPSSVLQREGSQAADMLPNAGPVELSAESPADSVAGDLAVPTSDAGLGSQRERSPLPTIPPSKHHKYKVSRDENNDVEIVLSPSVADAYMCNSVPVFVKQGTVCTPGLAPCTHAPSPIVEHLGAEDVYWRSSPSLEAPLMVDSDKQ